MKLLGGKGSPTAELLKAFRSGERAKLPELRREAASLADGLLSGIGDRLRRMDPLQRSEQTHAVHWLILGASILEASDADSEILTLLFAGRGDRIFLRLDTLTDPVADRYERRLRNLVHEAPEFAIWLEIIAHRRTRGEVRNGLARLESLLGRALPDDTPDDHRKALSRAYRAKLDKPITRHVESGLNIPTLAEGYVDHRFRFAFNPPSPNAGHDGWWRDRAVRSDLDLFLAVHLMSMAAHQVPLLVLGHPGSGKSVLTRILAARLPTDRFLPVRVELRSVDADADIQTQIETAIHRDTGEDVRWPRLVRSAPQALPVVLLDGFDELLQATGVSQTDYLLRVADFQEREAEQGRAVAVIVTSRTAVADRARLPQGSPVVRLEPFDERQIKAWLDIWARANEATLERRGLHPLPAETALKHPDLAEQPLLLLMLALYDATSNALQSTDDTLDRASLYEQLLKDFARREVEKEIPGPAGEANIERELIRLSIVAFAMFNRHAQWIDDENLTADLLALRIAEADGERRLRAGLTPGQLVVGRFFFVHDSHATRDGREIQTYEFLHATFGEYLIARLVSTLLNDMARIRRASSSVLPQAVDDGMLHALLSFECLAARAPIIEFLVSLISGDAIADLAIELFRVAHRERTESAFAAYRPSPLDVVQRHAAWSANLLLLATVAAGELTASRLFDDDAVYAWRRHAMTWRGQLYSEGWNGLVDSLDVVRGWRGGRRDLTLRICDDWFVAAPPDLTWTYGIAAEKWGDGARWISHEPAALRRRANFTGIRSSDLLIHDVEPLLELFPSVAHQAFESEDGEGRLFSAVNALLRAMAAPRGDARSTPYTDLLKVLMIFLRRSSADEDSYAELAFRVLLDAAELGSLRADLVPRQIWHSVFDASYSTPNLRIKRLRDRLLAVLGLPTAPAQQESESSPTPEPSPAESSPETPAKPPTAP